MNIAAVVCNIILFGFTCLVLVTDGPPQGARYIVFTLWSLLTLILNAVLISRSGAREGWLGLHVKKPAGEEQKEVGGATSMRTIMKIVAIICNLVFFGFVCWAIADQYPHPEEEGIVAFTVLIVLTPLLSLVVLFRSGAGDRWRGLHA